METTLGIPAAATGARFDETADTQLHATGVELADALAAGDSEDDDEEEEDDEDDEDEDAEDEGEGEAEGQ
jgi:hypothetical protein